MAVAVSVDRNVAKPDARSQKVNRQWCEAAFIHCSIAEVVWYQGSSGATRQARAAPR